MFLLSALLVVAEFSTVVAFDQAVLATWSSMMAPPFAELPWCVPDLLPTEAVLLSGRLTIFASISLAKSSSLVQLGVEHLTIWRIVSERNRTRLQPSSNTNGRLKKT